MKKHLKALVFIFPFIFVTYYLLATRLTFKIPYDFDYFSPLAKSFLSGRLDIPNPVVGSDLSYFKGKWYPYWGPLPALLLIPGQLILGRYFPPAYLSFLMAGLSIGVVYLIVRRLKDLYIHDNLTNADVALFLLFFAFGTSHLYIATRSGSWFVAQTVTLFSSALAVYILLKKKLELKDYFLASFLIALSLIGRYNIILYLIFLSLRLFDDLIFQHESRKIFFRKVFVSVIPVAFFFIVFALYNFARFGNPLDFGFTYTNFEYFDFAKIAPAGFYSLYYVPRNLFYMFLEIPKLTWLRTGQIIFDFNHFGMSIFFVSPVFLAALLTIGPGLFDTRNFTSRLMIYLWIQVVVQIMMLAPFFTLGFMQVGIRYATDFGLLLLILAIFGLRGRTNILVVLGSIMAMAMNIYYVFIA